ncbi:c-type cytochrome [Desulfuromonas versatilis]|uniref:C-type cytochrome n=1 Tax=Desulfuromonas versatilis TaxID=2802975 RepID=A0ABM8HN28_9BACT|nr:cytochrome c3 family protein [Desulfuromonas versatilis]BCR03989.1 c-type cytochrome [Desulfuromonas versatilis]
MAREIRSLKLVLTLLVCLIAALPAYAGESSCLSAACHADLNSPELSHAPAAEGNCVSCHRPAQQASSPAASEHPAFLPMDDAVCLTCHPAIGKTMKDSRYRHAALYRGNGCTGCHLGHTSDAAGLLVRDQKDLCLSCHDRVDHTTSTPLSNIAEEINGKPYLHGPLAEGGCTDCHLPHGSEHYRLLTGSYPAGFYAAYSEGIYDFCLQCHDKYLLRFADTTIYTQFRNGNRNLHYLHVADPRKGRTCRTCHTPHGAETPQLIDKKSVRFGDWQIPIRFESTATGGSCAPGCHPKMEYDRKNPAAN